MTKINDLKGDHKNARKRTDRSASLIQKSLEKFGAARSIVIDENNRILAGNGTIEGAKKAGLENVRVIETDGREIIAVKRTGLSEDEKVGLALADNRSSDLSEWDNEMLEMLSEEHDISDWFDNKDLNDLSEKPKREASGILKDRFGVPPFSVLNAREGWWQNRKKLWLDLGIKSEVGREEELTYNISKGDVGKRIMSAGGSTSVFDPVITELIYRWFSNTNSVILDPFAGGSVRGIVAAILGRKYIGVDLRKEQVEANKVQAVDLLDYKEDYFANTYRNYDDLTPIEKVGEYFVKRDDLFAVNGVNGGKVRTCYYLAQNAKGLVTAGSRESPQVNIVAHIAKELGIPCRVHTPEGKLSPEVEAAKNIGAEVIQHKAGYNSVIIKRAKDDAIEQGFKEIPFGMECCEAVEATKNQVKNIPSNTKRIVIPVGSGMSLSGLLHGLIENNLNIPVLGVRVGADPTDRLNKYAPKNWASMVTLVSSDLDYHQHEKDNNFYGLTLDPVYEAKCIKFIEKGDLLWVVGIRQTSLPVKTNQPKWITGNSQNIDNLVTEKADLIFSCPPYVDLEVYSKDPNDLSNMSFEAFKENYSDIIKKSCDLLNENSFACFVVGEVRKKDGTYYNFVSETIEAFTKAGLSYYNEAILITMVGSLPLRCGNGFTKSRKLGKTHQNVLIFVKGDPSLATQKCGLCEFADPSAFIEENEII